MEWDFAAKRPRQEALDPDVDRRVGKFWHGRLLPGVRQVTGPRSGLFPALLVTITTQAYQC